MPNKRISSTNKSNNKKLVNKIKIDEKSLRNMFNRNTINKIAKQTGFIKRQRKLNAFNFLVSITFGALRGKTLTLSAMIENFSKKLERASVNERFNKNAYIFLQEIYSYFFKKLTKAKNNLNIDLFNKFNEIKIIDSSSWKIPKALRKIFAGFNEAGCKIQLMMNYKSGAFSFIDLTRETYNDQSYSKQMHQHIQPNDLCVFDLGYVVAKAIVSIHKKKAFFYQDLIPRALHCMPKKEMNFINPIF